MRGRLRILLALAFAGAFALLPSPDADLGRPYLGYLLVRGWLLGADSPLASWCVAGQLPQLTVDLRQSPPLVEDDQRRERELLFARLAEEWAHGPGAAAIVTDLPKPLLVVRIGVRGVAAALPLPDGRGAEFSRLFPGRSSLLPAVVAIALAILTGRILLALLCGGLAGAIAHQAAGATDAFPPWSALVDGPRHFFADALLRRSLGEDFYLHITAFVALLFVLVGIVTSNGGIQGLVALLQRVVRGPVSAQLATFLSGLLVSFDDYTNCLLVSTTMRPLTDRQRVSREKLAYIVDSTAAPVAGLSVFSTWVVYEMSQYRAPLTLVTRPDGAPYRADEAFAVFLASLPFRFYSWFALALVVLVVLLRRDFGPMLAAERRARREPAARIEPPAGPSPGVQRAAPHAADALAPLLVLVLGTVAVLCWQGVRAAPPLHEGTGAVAALLHVLAHTRSDLALVFAALAACATAVAMTLWRGSLRGRELLVAAGSALRVLPVPFAMLFLAWSLGHVCRDLETSSYLTAAVRHAMTPAALPVLLFFTAGLVAFATGTSFGTMAILLPNVVVLSHQMGTDAAFGGSAAGGGPALMLVSIGAVLEGAIFGDHCSPLSDTTVLSSLGARCDHLAHVGTQLPYALLAMAAAALCGYLPVCWFGPGAWPAGLLAGLLLLAGVLLVCGRDPDRIASP